MRNTKKGFTLVELLVVIAILAILATVSVVGYTNYIKNANESLALQELTQVKSSILAEDIVNNNFAIGSDGKVNAEGEAKFNEYLAGLANGLNGTLAYADGKVTYTLKKDTSVVYVLDLKTGDVGAGVAAETPVVTYTKATSIAVGNEIIIVNETYAKELSGISDTSTKYGMPSDYTDSPEGIFVLTVVEGASSGTYAFKQGDNYLAWSSGNSLKLSTTLDDNSSWNVSFDADGNAVILNVADNTRNLQWNSDSNGLRFACYTSEQKAVQIYVKTVN